MIREREEQDKEGLTGLPRRRAGLLGPGERAKDSISTLKRLWGYLGRRQGQLALIFCLVFAGSFLALTGPLLIGRAVDVMVGGFGQVEFLPLARLVMMLLAVYLLSSLINWCQIYLMTGIAQQTVRDLRKDLFGKMQTLPLSFFDRQFHGKLMSRFTNDVEALNYTLSQGTTQIFSSVITVIGAISMMIYLSPMLTVISLLTIPLGILSTGKIAAQTRGYFTAQQKELGELNGFIEEIISGQRVVKAFGREEESINHFSRLNARLKIVSTKAQIFSGLIPPIMNVVNNLSFALAAFAGGWFAVQGTITVGAIASFLNYSRQFARPINEIANQFNMIQSALAGAERVFDLMDERPEREDSLGAQVITKAAGQVDLQNVTFGYQRDLPILKNVSISAAPGQTIALVGPTGAGKTTIVNLLTRFYEVDQGIILIDGKDIRDLEKDSLRSTLGIVLQDTYLFSDTVRENIRYGRLDATDGEVEEAARMANGEGFILRLPQGYETILSGQGGRISAGQRQLLTIARAVLADPSILILDEATSNVDTRTEVQIQRAMLSMMEGRTSFVIAHRLSTIRKADQILVLKAGEIIEKGTHEELIRARGFYDQLYQSQEKNLESKTEKAGECGSCVEEYNSAFRHSNA